jgi:hypothetical protein
METPLVESSGDGEGGRWKLLLPSTFSSIDVPAPAAPKSVVSFGPGSQQPPPNPLRARFSSADGATVLSLGVRRAADLKPTLLQAMDISEWGTIDTVASLLVPPKAIVTGARVRSQKASEMNSTGRTYFLYSFTVGGRRGALCAAVRRGFIFVALASTSGGDDSSDVMKLVDGLTLA